VLAASSSAGFVGQPARPRRAEKRRKRTFMKL